MVAVSAMLFHLLRGLVRSTHTASPGPFPLQEHLSREERQCPTCPHNRRYPFSGCADRRDNRKVHLPSEVHEREGQHVASHHPFFMGIDHPIANHPQGHSRNRRARSAAATALIITTPPVSKQLFSQFWAGP